jgi:long-subunit acyl-CoA synthetase (AMP-forming)
MREVFAGIAINALRHPSRPAVVDGDIVATYAELETRIMRAAAWARRLPRTVGLIGRKNLTWIIADLALAYAGKTVVPLPEFFSAGQLSHVAADAGVEHIVLASPDAADRIDFLGIGATPLEFLDSAIAPSPSRRVIYTSGSTGNPKGVRLSGRHIDQSVVMLSRATAASRSDRHLSILPFALLLEQIAGIYLPLHSGASIHLAPDVLPAFLRADPAPLLRALAESRATTTVIVPEILNGWIASLARRDLAERGTLRFVAVGGAPVSASLAGRAWSIGLPVYEGYGLSECCAVVAVNKPLDRAGGTVGRPLDGVSVAIDEGEIVVSGPTVMEGYIGGPDPGGTWRTGDLGTIVDGRLVIHGRKDSMIVTALGRNIHPEWIEAMLAADPRVGRCILSKDGAYPLAVIVPSPLGREWFARADAGMIEHLIADACRAAPDYARPARCFISDEADLIRSGLLTANGRPRREAVARHFSSLPPP